MITRIVKVKIKLENVEDFKTYIKSFLCEAIAFKNNHHADCFADLDEQNHFHIYTIWNTEGALNKFRKSDTNIEFRAKLLELSESRHAAWTVENIGQ
ncbi:MAG: antibiotic biosynthesis monooxygenase [Salinivirgaceae bacterium]|jgi:quinol monooxygenase YgiN|nr:antibiotic biosynthesis monooxygenase [Salinivirgaceae bacterium]